jgi:hypothetical protein
MVGWVRPIALRFLSRVAHSHSMLMGNSSRPKPIRRRSPVMERLALLRSPTTTLPPLSPLAMLRSGYNQESSQFICVGPILPQSCLTTFTSGSRSPKRSRPAALASKSSAALSTMSSGTESSTSLAILAHHLPTRSKFLPSPSYSP